MKEIKRSTKIQLLKSGACILVALVLIINTVFLYANNDGEDAGDENQETTVTITEEPTEEPDPAEETIEDSTEPPIAGVPEAIPDNSETLTDSDEDKEEAESSISSNGEENEMAEEASAMPDVTPSEMPTAEPSTSPTATPSIMPEIAASISKTSNGIKGTGLDEITVSFDTKALDKENAFDIILSTEAEDITVDDTYKIIKNGNKYAVKALQKNATTLTVSNLGGEAFNLYAEGTEVTFTYDAYDSVEKIEDKYAGKASITVVSDKEEPLEKEEKKEVELSEQKIAAHASDGAWVYVNGLLPEGATVTAVPVSVEIEGQKVLAAYDITILDADGKEYTITESVKVSITAPALKESNADEVSVYHMENPNAEAEKVAEVGINNNKVTFDAEQFSTYAVTEKIEVPEGTVSGDWICMNDHADPKVTITNLQTENSRDSEFSFVMEYAFSNLGTKPTADSNVAYFQIPSELVGVMASDQSMEGTTYSKDGKPIGTYMISGNNIIFTYDKDWLNTLGNDINGTFRFKAKVSTSASQGQDKVVLKFDGVNDPIEIPFDEGTVDGKKEHTITEDGKIEFTITFDVKGKIARDVEVTDTLGDNLQFVNGSFTLDGKECNADIDGNVAVISIAELGTGKHEIKYKAEIVEGASLSDTTNKVEWKWSANEKGKDYTDWIGFKKENINKRGEKDRDRIKWIITVEPDALSTVAGKTINDQLGEGHTYEGSYTIYKGDYWHNNVVNTIEIPSGAKGFEYTFTTDDKNPQIGEKYTVVYYTTPDDSSIDGAIYKNNLNGKDYEFKYETEKPDVVQKSGIANNFEKESKDSTITWRITVDLSKYSDLESLVLEDSWDKGEFVENSISYTYENGEKINNDITSETVGDKGLKFTFDKNLLGSKKKVIITYKTKGTPGEEAANTVISKYAGYEETDIGKATYTKLADVPFGKSGEIDGNIIEWTITANEASYGGAPEIQLCKWENNEIVSQKYSVYDKLPNGLEYIDGSATYEVRTYNNVLCDTGFIEPTVENGNLVFSFNTENWGSEKYNWGQVWYRIKFKTQITKFADGNDASQTFVNEAEFKKDEESLSKTSAEVTIKNKIISKKGTALEADNGATTRISYNIIVNYEGKDLIKGSNTLTLVDTLDEKTTLDVSSIKVTDLNSGYPVDFKWSYNSVGGQDTLVLEIPDEQALKVAYEVSPQVALTTENEKQNGKTVTVKNTAQLSGVSGSETSEENVITVKEHSSQAGAAAGSISIMKYDSKTAKPLSGAEFTLYRMDNGEWIKIGSETTGSDGSITFKTELGGSSLQSDRLYYFVETQAPDGYKLDETLHYFMIKGDNYQEAYKRLDGAIKAKLTTVNETKTFLVPNEAAPQEGSLAITKILDGEDLPENITKKVYEFQIIGEDGKVYDENGDVDESRKAVIKITGAASKTISGLPVGHYTVTEKNAEVEDYIWNVSITEAAKGETDTEAIVEVKNDSVTGVTFTNKYTPKKGSIEVSKIVSGTTTAAGPFYFVLTDPAGNRVAKEDGTDVYEISAKGKVKIDGLTIGIYHLKETDDKGNDVVTGKEFPYTVTYSSEQIEVETAETTEFTITNTYEKYETKGSLPLTAHKSYNRSLLGNDFHFIVTENGKTILEADNDSQGNIDFGSISYNGLEAEGDHTYEIREQVEDNDKKKGITYSETVYTLTVNVKDNGDHQLIPTIISLVDQAGNSVEIGKLEFKNEYKATGKLNLTASKTVDLKTPAEDEVFDFELWNSDADGNLISKIETTKNTLGEITFKQIDYNENSISTHYYLVRETGAKAGYNLDTKKYLVKVIVSDNDLDGVLELTEEYSILSETGDTTTVDSITFDNTYNPTEDSVVIKATKELKNGNISKYTGKFSFTLEGYGVKGGKETVSNTGENGTEIVFSEIKYGKSDIGKDYTYTITEEASNLGSVVTNDPVSERKVIVKVRADRNTGKITATAEYKPVTEYLKDNGAVFHNEYHASGSVKLIGSKVFTGKDLTEGMFNFEVKEGNETKATGTNDKDGNIKFTEITYDKAGTHVYTVSEVIPQEAKQNNNVLNGITYDAKSYEVTVTLTDDEQGNLNETVTYNPEGGIVFENEYNVIPIKVTLEGTKTLTGRDMKEGEFSFEVVETVDGKENVVAEGSNMAAKGGEAGSIIFSEIEYTQAGSHTYTVREVKGGSTENGVSYTGNTFEVVVKITDNGLGGLEPDVQYKDEEIEFKNSYSAVGDVTLKAHKTVDGAAPATNENGIFTFEVLENGEVIRTAQNNSGDVEFETIPYTLDDVGPHTYTIREKRQNVEGYSYDLTEYEVEVVVSDGKYGELNVGEPIYKKAGTPVNEESVVFNNIKDGSTVIEASKELLGGGELIDDMFTFVLTSNDPGFTSQTVTNKGTRVNFPIIYTRDDIDQVYHYTIKEMPSTFTYITDDPVAERNVTVTVNEVGGKIVTSVEYEPVTKYPDDKGAVFHNTYSAVGHTTISGTKELTGRDIKSGEFTFKLYRVNDDNSETYVTETTNTANDGKGFSFNNLEFTSVGTYIYRVKEENAGQKVDGVTYDSASFDVMVVVTDNNDGTLNADDVRYPEGGITFENSYTAQGTSITFEGTKNLTGRSSINEEFEFEVKDAEGNVVSTGKNNTDAEDNIVFTPIQYTKAGTYVYTVSEKKPDGHVNGVYHSVTYDSNVFTVTVKVTDDGAGQLVAVIDRQNSDDIEFKNDYSTSKPFTLTASKTVDGNEPKEGEVFKFILTGGYGDKQENQTEITNTGSTITFDKIYYDQDDIGKTFIYTVTESQETLQGYKYDERVYTVEVTVTDVDLDGELEINPVYYEGVDEDKTQVDSIKFNNEYTPASDEVKLQATKKLENGTLSQHDFWFTLTSRDHKEGFEPQRVSNDGTLVKFDPITYTKDDIDKTYHYIITEEGPEEGKLNGVTYDTARERHVTVEVKAVNGQIVATETYEVCDAHAVDGNAAIFHNSYDAEGGFTPQGTKTLTGRDTDGGEFWFVVKEGDKELQRVSSSAAKDGEAGKINFTEIKYTLDDVGPHTYTVSEENAGTTRNGVTYGSESYTITVDVEDNHDGTFRVVDTYSPDVTDKTMTFTNTYDAKIDYTLSGTKKLTGRNMAGEEFHFVVMEGDEQKATGINTQATDGTATVINFTEIHYTLADLGEHTYTITEVNDDLPKGVARNSQSFTVVVNVTDNEENGTLTATIVSKKSDTVAFENTYTASVPLELEATKTVNDKEPTGDEVFTFTLTGGLGDKTVNQSKQNEGTTVTFDAIQYDQNDVGNTFIYTVKESAENVKKGYTYDKTKYTVEVTVNRDDTVKGGLSLTKVIKVGGMTPDDQTIRFNNTYPEAGGVDLVVWKDLQYGTLTGGEFNFTLTGPKLPATGQTKSNVGNEVKFDRIPLDKSDIGETYVYTITEQVDSNKTEYVTYDTELTRTVTVKVGEVNGEVEATSIVYSSDGKYEDDDKDNVAIFHNTYKAKGELTLEGTKDLTGRTLTDKDKFKFVVIDESKEKDNVVATGTNDGETIKFDPITYNQSQIGKTYNYLIMELPSGNGIKYDNTKYYMDVTVTDPKHDGKLVLDYSYPTGGLVFVNEYAPKEIWISKVDAVSKNELVGASMTITSEDGEVLESWVSDGERHAFKADYGKAYTLTETAAPEGFLIADSITFRIDSDGVICIKQADGNFVQQSGSVVTMVDAVTPTPEEPPTPEETPTPSTTPSATETPAPSATPGTTPGATATPAVTPGQTPAPEETPTPEETPAPDNTPNPVVTPGNNPAPTPRGTVLGARKVKVGGTRAAVLGARRGAEFAVLGKRRRPSTGDSMALLIWIITMSVAMGGAITSSTMLSSENGRKRRKRR